MKLTLNLKQWCLQTCGSMAVMVVLLGMGGCAGTMVRSEVTVFQEWPADVGARTYTFVRTPVQDNDLEYRSYERLVQQALSRLGFSEAAAPAAHLTLTMGYANHARDVRVVEAVESDPFWINGPLIGHRWRGRGYYGPYYDPFWADAGNIGYRDSTYQVFHRRLHITIAQRPSGKQLFAVTVTSEGSDGNLARAMPYLVRSAFTDFPGVSGVPRQIDLPVQP